jgi:septal ring factor EnvC (AmiA/AmiB activator)
MRAPIVLALAVAAIGGVAWAASPDRLRAANDAAAVATRQAEALDARAAASEDPVARARWSRLAVAARVRGAEAGIAAAEERSALVGARLLNQRAELATQQGPVARLLAALVALARRPALATLTQPGSVADLVHVQAVLSTTMPAVATRTAALRDELARTRALQASAAVARASLETGRGRLLEAREQLAALSGEEGETAQALGERTRDIVDQLGTIGSGQATLGDLVALPGPPVVVGGETPRLAAYRLPVAGRLVMGLGEVSDNGVRARGLTFAVAPAARIVAPAAGRVVFAGPFRSFGRVAILDHGDGWTTLIAGLGALAVRTDDEVGAGAAIGRAAGGEDPRVTVELRRRGRPVDIAALLG